MTRSCWKGNFKLDNWFCCSTLDWGCFQES